MESTRKKEARQECGLDDSKEREEIAKAVAEEEKRRAKKEEKKKELLETPVFQTMTTIRTVMDKFMIDPIIGFVAPAAGDIISAICALPFIYFSLFKVKSIRLALACIFNTVVDMAIGLIPILGDIFDLFHRSYKKNLDMIVGYVNNEDKAIHDANTRCLWIIPLLIVFAGLLFVVYKVICNIIYYI